MEDQIITHAIGEVSFQLRELRDFSFLNNLGQVFTVFDRNDSGNISFGLLTQDQEKLFVKVAGVKTVNSFRSPSESVLALKECMSVYKDIHYSGLIELIEHFEVDDLYVAIFKWANGACLFDHWNFEKYQKNPNFQSPMKKFKRLSAHKKMSVIKTLVDFLIEVERKDYVAVDFYDGSIMYDFDHDLTTICDIDFFRKAPIINTMGEEYWGTKRMKAPEEYQLGAEIDVVTNVYTLGALIFHLIGTYSDEEISRMYHKKEFSPCTLDNWSLDKTLYDICCKAVQREREHRFASIRDFKKHWEQKS